MPFFSHEIGRRLLEANDHSDGGREMIGGQWIRYSQRNPAWMFVGFSLQLTGADALGPLGRSEGQIEAGYIV